MTNNSLITEVDLIDETKSCFLTYAEEVLTDRAIPSAEDGLLSVHRKLIWTMEEILKMDSKAKYKKSASIVGSTLASSYYHGDAACYGAMCKLAQPYLMRYPLVDGDGNFGSQEGNGMEAASRYTNARPSEYSDLMLNDFKKNVVPLKETYNGEYYEPVILPSLFPNALVNGRESIGISMAHNSQPMNLTEVCNGIIAYIKNNDVTVDDLMEYIKGPDYPLGGTVINKKDIRTAFATGKSETSLKVRGNYEIEGNKIIFTSIPYRTYRDKIKAQIKKNIDDFDKLLSDFSDESNVGKNRLVFTLKEGVQVNTALNAIFKLTDLQTTLSYNMNFIVNGTPKLCSLKELIIAYYNHQIDVLIKATTYDKEKLEARIHILEGLLKAIDKIDEVIDLIRNSTDKTAAEKALIEFLKIDSIQAKAILDMKLSRLTKIDKNELIQEKKSKEELLTECNKILNNKEYRDNKLISEIESMRDKYGDARRTELTQIEVPKQEKEIQYVEPEKCVVIMTKDETLKRIPATSFRTQRRNGKGIKTKGDIISATIRTNTIDSLMIFTNLGNMYRVLVDNIPVGTNSSKGTPIRNLITMLPNETATLIYSIYRDTDAKYVLFTTRNGMIKKTSLDEYINTKKKSGVKAINLREGDEITSVNLIKDEDLILLTHQGMGIKFKSTDLSISSRVSLGLKGMGLKEDDYVVSCLPIRHNTDTLAIFSTLGLGKKINLSDLPLQNRGGKGTIVYKVSSTSGEVVDGTLVSDEDAILISGGNSSICILASEIPLTSKTALGNQLIKDNKVSSISKV